MTQTSQLHAPRQESAGGTSVRPAVLFAGAVMIAAGVVQVDGAILTQAYRGSSPVAEDRLTFPWDGATAVATTLTWGLTQLLLVAALVVWTRSGGTGPSRGGRIGATLAVVGGALLAAGHALTLRAGRWTSWRRYAPLAVAVALLAAVPLQFTPVLPVAVALYALTIVALGIAMLAEGGNRR
jgi:hypothetical protein